MDVTIEDFALTGSAVEEADRIMGAVQRGLHDQLAFELGFQLPQTASLEDAKKFYGEPMTTSESNTWMAFLPNHYSHSGGKWGYCDPKLVPPAVMERVHIAHQRRVFDDLQIWAAAPGDIDPMVVGVVWGKNRWYYFKIARWGESLASFGAIKETIKLRRQFVRTFLQRGAFIWGLAVIIAVTTIALTVPSLRPIVIVVGVVLFVFGQMVNILPDRRIFLERRAARRYKPEASVPSDGLMPATA